MSNAINKVREIRNILSAEYECPAIVALGYVVRLAPGIWWNGEAGRWVPAHSGQASVYSSLGEAADVIEAIREDFPNATVEWRLRSDAGREAVDAIESALFALEFEAKLL